MNLRDYELLYDLPSGEYDGRSVKGIRTVTIRAGRSLEVMCHPLAIHWTDGAKRAAKERRTPMAMAAINARNLERKIMRLTEANFSHLKAVVLTGTYEYPDANDIGMMNIDDVWDRWQRDGLPEHIQDVRRDVRKFLQRIRRRMQNPKALKWILRIEEDDKLDAFGLPTRFHIHMLIEAENLSAAEIADQWPHGFTRCDRFDLNHDGAARIARYITKNKKCGRIVSHSRNLVMPQPRISDRKVSRRRAALIAADVLQNGKEILEQIYPGYQLMEPPRVYFSDFGPGAYIYARMRRRD